MTSPRYTLLAGGASARNAVLGTGALLVIALLSWPYTVDDAFITARYACNLAAGHGYVMNAAARVASHGHVMNRGAHVASDGVTGPLWLVPEVLACAIGFEPILAAKLVGLASMLLAVWLTLRALSRRRCGRYAAAVAAVLLALSPSLGTWAIAGLETGAATLLLTVAALAATRRPELAPRALGLASGALAWLRPELALPCATLLMYALLRDKRAALRAWSIALAGVAALLVFRAAMFGHLLPLSLAAKAGSLSHGFEYLSRSVVLSTSLVGVGLAAYGAVFGRGSDRALGYALLAHALSIVLAGGDWMPGYRLLVPVLPVYAILAGLGAARMSALRPRLAVLLVALACVLPALDLATRIPDLRASAETRRRAQPLVAWLVAHVQSVALIDVGFIGYASAREVVDLAGLTDARVARMPGGHLDKRIDEPYLRARNPDAIVLHTASPPQVDAEGRLRAFTGFAVEQRVAALPFVQANYRVDRIVRCAPDYEYIVLARAAGR